MKSISNAKGLRSLRTATTNRIHTKPPQKGTEFLNLYLLDTEARRLEMELNRLEHRQKGIQLRLFEIRQDMARLTENTSQSNQELVSEPNEAMKSENPTVRDFHASQWKKMAVQY